MAAQRIATLCQRKVTAEKSTARSFASGGEWLPLDVWAVKGFNADLIEANATDEDKKYDAKNKWMNYRVSLETDMVVDTQKTTDAHELTQKRRTRALKRKTTAEAEEEMEKEEEFSQDSECSSNSSEVAREKEKVKKEKKDKKAKKEKQEKREKPKAKAKPKGTAKSRAKAKACSQMCSKALATLRKVAASEYYTELLPEDMAPVSAAIARLKRSEKACTEAGEQGHDGVDALAAADLEGTMLAEKALKKKINQLEKAVAK